ncbi:MAG: hypothetical protein QM485_10435 [Flavobacteriaceae bacterium]
MRRVFFMLIVIALSVSCLKDDDDVLNTELEGKWILANASCFCFFGDNPDFSGHKITFESGSVNVENSGDFQFLINATGAYTENGKVITLKNGRQYSYIIKSDTLQLTFVDEPNIADDELFLEYRRN